MNKRMCALLCSTAILLAGCGAQQAAQHNQPEAAATQTDQQIAEQRIEYGDIKLINPKDTGVIPQYYQQLGLEGSNVDIYLFVDEQGEFQYRAYAQQNITINDIPMVKNGFVRAALDINDGGFTVKADKGVSFIDQSSEKFGQVAPMDKQDDVPACYQKTEGKTGLYQFTNIDGENEYRVYGAFPNQEPHFWPADSAGQMIPGALYVDVELDEAKVK